MADELTSETVKYITSTPLEKRKRLGQYMTPRSIRDIAVAQLPLKDGDKVLDPAVGTGELLLAVREKNPNVELYGWDIDDKILNTAETNLNAENTNTVLEVKNVLQVTDRNGFFDVAIVNPPYFELKPSLEETTNFGDIIKGRANIYAFFIKKVIELTKDNGYMVFIVPPSMNNGSYFEALREYIIKHAEIKSLEIITDSSLFVEAQTSVQVLLLQKKKKPTLNRKHVLNLKKITNSPKERYIFSEDAKKIASCWENKTSIHNLGYDVITGSLIWNLYREHLSDKKKNNNYVEVFYSKDISNDGKVVRNSAMNKKRYLDSTQKTPLEGEAIIVNRIVGGVGVGNIRAALVSGKYYAENHVNVIIPREGTEQLITLEELHKKLVEDESIPEYLQLFTGNTQLSATELKFFIPVKL